MDVNFILSAIFYFYMFYVCIKILEGCQKGEFNSSNSRRNKKRKLKYLIWIR